MPIKGRHLPSLSFFLVIASATEHRGLRDCSIVHFHRDCYLFLQTLLPSRTFSDCRHSDELLPRPGLTYLVFPSRSSFPVDRQTLVCPLASSSFSFFPPLRRHHYDFLPPLHRSRCASVPCSSIIRPPEPTATPLLTIHHVSLRPCCRRQRMAPSWLRQLPRNGLVRGLHDPGLALGSPSA